MALRAFANTASPALAGRDISFSIKFDGDIYYINELEMKLDDVVQPLQHPHARRPHRMQQGQYYG
jgi:hypothetical protein